MRRGRTAFAVAAAALAGGTAVLWKRHASRRRQRQLRDGEIRELRGLWANVGGCRLFARCSAAPQAPPSAPVVLVHGFGISSSYFVPLAERLAPKFDVYAPDLPGHGRSDTPARPLGIPRLADALLTWMDAVGLRRAALVGHSLGCEVAAEAVVRRPDRFDRLVLIGPAGDPARRTTGAMAARLLACAPFEHPAIMALIATDYLRMGPRLVPEFDSMLRYRVEDRLPRARVPVLVVRGEFDAVAPQDWVDEVARLTGAVGVVVIPGGGHAVQYSAPRAVADAIAPFLRARTGLFQYAYEPRPSGSGGVEATERPLPHGRGSFKGPSWNRR